MATKSTKKHFHVAIPKHTRDEAARFYALVNDLGHDPEEAKERACKKFEVSCFNSISSEHMVWLNKKLQTQLDAKEEGN